MRVYASEIGESDTLMLFGVSHFLPSKVLIDRLQPSINAVTMVFASLVEEQKVVKFSHKKDLTKRQNFYLNGDVGISQAGYESSKNGGRYVKAFSGSRTRTGVNIRP